MDGEPQQTNVETQQSTPIVENENKPTYPLAAVIVAGMGPVSLDDLKASERLYPKSPLARRNAQAAKVLSASGMTGEIIMSGFASSLNAEVKTTEAQLQMDTFDRMRPTFLHTSQREEALKKAKITEEPNASTTFDNIIQGINLLDARNDGKLFDGNFAVLSAHFHTPRIQEMLKAFGLNGKVLSSEEIMHHYGYGNLDPAIVKIERKIDDPENPSEQKIIIEEKPFHEFEEGIYNSQPAGLKNLQENPTYVTFELAKIESDERLQQMSSSLREYYRQRNITLPDCYNNIPDSFDPNFSYNNLRKKFNEIKSSKLQYEGLMSGSEYRALADITSQKTTDFLNENDPNPPKINRKDKSPVVEVQTQTTAVQPNE